MRWRQGWWLDGGGRTSGRMVVAGLEEVKGWSGGGGGREGKQIIIRSTPYQSLGVRRVTALPRIIGPLIFATPTPSVLPSCPSDPPLVPALDDPRPGRPTPRRRAIDPPAAEGLRHHRETGRAAKRFHRNNTVFRLLPCT